MRDMFSQSLLTARTLRVAHFPREAAHSWPTTEHFVLEAHKQPQLLASLRHEVSQLAQQGSMPVQPLASLYELAGKHGFHTPAERAAVLGYLHDAHMLVLPARASLLLQLSMASATGISADAGADGASVGQAAEGGAGAGAGAGAGTGGVVIPPLPVVLQPDWLNKLNASDAGAGLMEQLCKRSLECQLRQAPPGASGVGGLITALQALYTGSAVSRAAAVVTVGVLYLGLLLTRLVWYCSA